MEIWRGIDAYLVNVDQQLCSPECPCYLTNTLPFTDNPSVVSYFNQWTLTPEIYGAVAFQNCTSTVRNSAYSGAITLDPNFDPNSEFNSLRFADYMSRIENEFNCSGWCRINYINRITGQNMVISKYLFTNINRSYIYNIRGPPQNQGCYYPVINWIIPYLLAWGSVTMVLVGFQVILYKIDNSIRYANITKRC